MGKADGSSRLLSKAGRWHIRRKNARFGVHYALANMHAYLLSLGWLHAVGLLVLVSVCSWLGFAGLWYAISATHGDLRANHTASMPRCLDGQLNAFVDLFLFSWETQTTVGYGAYTLLPACGWGVVLLIVQSCFGGVLQQLINLQVFFRVHRENLRGSAFMFSKHAVVGMRDGQMCLMVRVVSLQRRPFVRAQLRLSLVRRGGHLASHDAVAVRELQVGFDKPTPVGCRLFLAWPCVVTHPIDHRSPLYHLAPRQLKRAKWEITAILTGVGETINRSLQARSSYLPAEILWGYRFCRVSNLQLDNGVYEFDLSKFNELESIENMPQYSAYELERAKGRLEEPTWCAAGGEGAARAPPSHASDTDTSDSEL